MHYSSPSITGSAVRNNGKTGMYLSYTSNPVIGAESEGNVISGNGTYGVYADGTRPLPTIEYNTFEGNGSYPIRVGADAKVNHNTFSGNGVQAVYFYGENLTADATWSNAIPAYVISGDVTVRGAAKNGVARLTIDPGVTVKFTSGSGLTIGYDGSGCYNGVLSAQGTEASPITFTSNAVTPMPGDWKGIILHNCTPAGENSIERCIIEYGGHTNNANIYVKTKSEIRNNTIRNSSHSGIRIAQRYTSDSLFACNNFKDNRYGVFTQYSAMPIMENNNFLRNLNYGVYNDSGGSTAMKAENNWWGDENGPGNAGDKVRGNVDFTPWLATTSGCIEAPPLNDPPFPPRIPTPADNAAGIPANAAGQPADIALKWSGGDPNPWDATEYDIYFGESEYSLALAASGVADLNRTVTGLAEGRAYFWQVVARDDMGGETVGPMWRFTTLSTDPDHTPPGTSKCGGPRSGAGPGNIECE